MGWGGGWGLDRDFFFPLCLWNNEYNGTGVMNMKPSLPRVLMKRLQCVTNQGELCYSNGGRACLPISISLNETNPVSFSTVFLEHSFYLVIAAKKHSVLEGYSGRWEAIKTTDCCFDKNHSVSRAATFTSWKGSKCLLYSRVQTLEILRELL